MTSPYPRFLFLRRCDWVAFISTKPLLALFSCSVIFWVFYSSKLLSVLHNTIYYIYIHAEPALNISYKIDPPSFFFIIFYFYDDFYFDIVIHFISFFFISFFLQFPTIVVSYYFVLCSQQFVLVVCPCLFCVRCVVYAISPRFSLPVWLFQSSWKEGFALD
jgi:hypothetical protein